MRRWTRWLPIIVLLCGLLLIYSVRTQPALALRVPLGMAVPVDLLGHVGSDLDVREQEIQSARATEFLAREYRDPDGTTGARAFEVHVCYYATRNTDKWAVAPRLCHQDPAWSILNAQTDSLSPEGFGSVTIKRYNIQRDNQRAIALYWHQGRGHVEADMMGVRWNLLRDGILHQRSDEALVRVFVPFGEDEAQALELASRVATEIVPQVETALPAP